MNKYYGIWLLLEKYDELRLAKTVEDLSRNYLNGEVFIPHLSIFPSFQIDLEELSSILKSNFASLKGFTVETKGIAFEDRWSKTLYVDIELNSMLMSIHQKLKDLFPQIQIEGNSYHPHISLIYSTDLLMVEKAKQQKLLESLIPNNLEVSIRSIGIVDPGVEGENWRDFSKWSVVEEIKFV